MSDVLEDLYKKAKAASQGEWGYDDEHLFQKVAGDVVGGSIAHVYYASDTHVPGSNGPFLAAAYPRRVATLVELLLMAAETGTDCPDHEFDFELDYATSDGKRPQCVWCGKRWDFFVALRAFRSEGSRAIV